MRPKTRTIAGGLVVAGALLGSYLSGLMPDFGTGSGIGVQTVTNGPNPQPPAEQEPDQPDRSPDQPAEDPAETIEPTAGPTEVLTVHVRDDQYLIPSESGEALHPVELDEAVRLAQQTTGNEDGIRVRIRRHRSARVVAWSTLYDRLEESGIKRDAITMPRELIDDEDQE